MLLPRGEPLLENTKVRFVNLDTLLADDFESSLKKTEKNTGYVSLSYAKHKDILVIVEGRIAGAVRLQQGKKRVPVGIDQVFSASGEDPEGVVNYYRISIAFLEMFWDATVTRPIHDHLSSSFIYWNKYLDYLRLCDYSGYLETDTRGMLGYYRFQRGIKTDSIEYQPIAYGKEVSSIRVFSLPEPHFIPETEKIKLTFLDIFKDMLQTTFSILVQSEQVNSSLSKALNLARKKYPEMLKGVHNKKSGLLDFDVLLKNLDDILPSQKKDMFIGSLIEVLYERLLEIKDKFGQDIVVRTVKELKLVQLYHQQSLHRFQVGDTLLSLWKRFD